MRDRGNGLKAQPVVYRWTNGAGRVILTSNEVMKMKAVNHKPMMRPKGSRVLQDREEVRNVANLPLRTPQIIAKSFASLDILTKGRIELGIGAGANRDAIEAYGGPKRSTKEGIEALEEGINVIKMLWGVGAKTKIVSYNGKYYFLKNAYPGPKPFHDIKIIIGANGPRMLDLTGKLGDGWSISMFYFLPDELKDKIKILEESCKKYGRDVNSLIKIYNIAGVITEERTGIQIDKNNLLFANHEEWAEFIIKIYKDLKMNTFIFWPSSKNKSEQIKTFSEKVKEIIKNSI